MTQIQLAFLGATELIIILVIVLVVFGASRLPKLGDSLGKGIKNFRKSFKDDPREIEGQAKPVEKLADGQNNHAGEMAAEVKNDAEESKDVGDKNQ
jgi:sec-independent protein translocase protein TatA